jgi:hypothetical protein
MGLYSVAFTGPQITRTAPKALCEIQASATDYPRIKEISGAFLNAGTAAVTLGVGIPAAVGVIKTSSSFSVIPYIPASDPSCSVIIGTDWTTQPTAPTAFFKRMSVNNTTSTFIQFDFVFKTGIVIAPNSSLVLWVISSTATSLIPQLYDINVELDS